MADEEATYFRDLLTLIEQTLYDAPADVDCALFLQALQRAKPAFLNLLRYKASGRVSLHVDIDRRGQQQGTDELATTNRLNAAVCSRLPA